ncbi:MAG: RagB/SusD family nutrient uptake outer membrane protein [Chitinophagaceae bacterium]|nr:RagB/SusD family nutrient uptake outer membrane protein [Chitinophagaceae bacterium]
MKKSFIIYLSAGILATSVFSSCKKEIGSLNGPAIEDLTTNPTKFQLNNVVIGTESGIRNALDFYLDVTGVIGREIYRFAGSEPRYTMHLLGAGNLSIDGTVFLLTNPWNARYRAVKSCNIIIEGATNSTSITQEQRKGFLGFAKTIKAYELLLNLNLTYTNGIRVDVNDPDHPGPFLGYPESLTAIWNLLNEAKTDLQGAVIEFPLSTGFDVAKTDGKVTADGFLKFNRALAARVAVYRQDWPGALTALNESFFDLNGTLSRGFYHVYSTGPNDQTNLAFVPQNSSGEIRLAHPSFATNIIPGDDRIQKTSLRTASASQNDLTSNRDVWVYTSNVAPVPIITNEELVLIYAEAKINNTAFPDAIVALNRIRTAHNLTAYAGTVTQAALINEMLYQRRYSLFFTGHRWVDMRRYNKLGELPLDRPGDDVLSLLPRPTTEGQ